MIVQKSKGFTLIELLVVIAIIAILAAILFPVFTSAKERARSATCVSNLKQISYAFMTYKQDYSEKFPRMDGYYPFLDYGWITVTYADGSWLRKIWKYTAQSNRYELKSYGAVSKKTSIFTCPTAASNIKDSNYQGTGSSYAYNGLVGGSNVLVRQSSITVLCRDWSVADGYNCFAIPWAHPTDRAKDIAWNFAPGWAAWPPKATQYVHSNGANCAFTDGHVKWVPKGNFNADMFNP